LIRLAEEALQFVKRALGGEGSEAPETILEDGLVRQSIDVGGRVGSAGFDIGLGPGLFSCMIRSNHVAAGDITETLDPYNPGTTANPLALAFPDDLEWWYLGVGCILTVASQTIDEVQFGMDPVAIEGFSDGTLVNFQSVLARWDGQVANSGGGIAMINALTGAAFQAPPFPIRWSRNNLIRVSSQTTGAGATELNFSSWWYLGRRGLIPSAF